MKKILEGIVALCILMAIYVGVRYTMAEKIDVVDSGISLVYPRNRKSAMTKPAQTLSLSLPLGSGIDVVARGTGEKVLFSGVVQFSGTSTLLTISSREKFSETDETILKRKEAGAMAYGKRIWRLDGCAPASCPFVLEAMKPANIVFTVQYGTRGEGLGGTKDRIGSDPAVEKELIQKLLDAKIQ